MDPQHHVVLLANDDELDLFLTFISTNTYEILGKLSLKGDDPNAQNIKATDGIEQCQWSPRTGKFYLAVPEVNGSGSNTQPGAVLEIDPISRKVEKVFSIDFGFLPQTGTPGTSGFKPATADCLGPQGMAIGPQGEILLGCSNGGTIGTAPNTITVAVGQGSVIINERNGDLVRSLDGLNGNDEVWYNPGNNHYFLAGSNHNLALPTPVRYSASLTRSRIPLTRMPARRRRQAPIRLRLTRSLTRYTSRAITPPQAFAPVDTAASPSS